jgi:hypothetical protein
MKPEEFYEQVSIHFSILRDKYGFDPVFELKPAGANGLSQIIFQGNEGLIEFKVNYRDLDVSILLSFDKPLHEYWDEPPKYNGEIGHGLDCKWYPIVIAINAAGGEVDYARLYKGVSKTDADIIVKQLLENWANELSPHWAKIVKGMCDSAFQNKLKEMEESGKHQKITRFDQYGMANDFFKWLLKKIPVAIGYILSLFLGLVLVGQLGESAEKFAMLIVLIPPFLFYLILRFSRQYLENRKRRRVE